MSMRIYKLEGGTSAKGVVAGLLIAGAGLVLLVFGIALLAVLAVAGTAVGLGIIAYRRLTGRPVLGFPTAKRTTAGGLDPSLEVFADDGIVADRPVRELPDSLPPR